MKKCLISRSVDEPSLHLDNLQICNVPWESKFCVFHSGSSVVAF